MFSPSVPHHSPGVQGVHSVLFFRPVVAPKVPRGHGTATSLPRGQYPPSGHSGGELNPAVAQSWPGRQSRHELEKESGWKVPGSHRAASKLPRVEYDPGPTPNCVGTVAPPVQ